jgi:hypothetical protein
MGPPPQFGQQPPAPQYGQPPGFPQQPPAPQYGQPPGFGQPQPQFGHAPAPPQFGHAPAAAGGGFGGLAAGMPTSAPGTLFGIPFSLMKDDAFLKKVLAFSAVALVVTRFVPFSLSPLIFSWSMGFGFFIWPLIVAAGYALVSLAPQHIKDKVPPVVLKWLPFVLAYYSVGSAGVAGGGMLGYAYPLLVFGMVVRIQDSEDLIARGFVALGALASLGATFSMLSYLFSFSGIGIFGILHNLLQLAVVLAATGCICFAIDKWVPAVKVVEPFAPIVTAVLIVWPVVSTVLQSLRALFGGAVFMAIFGLAHFLVLYIAYFGVLLLTAPAAFDILKGLLAKSGVATTASAVNLGGAPAAGAPTMQQKLAELDAAWQRGGMTPDEYQQRRNAILAGG